VRRAAAALAAAAVLSGCGGNEPSVPGQADLSGRFVGTDGHGVGLSVDFTGYDAEKRAIETALQTESSPASVGIVSIVNRTRSLVPIPALTATMPDGRHVPLALASKTLRRGSVVPLPDPGPYVPVRGALTVYVLFPGRVFEIRQITMRVGDGDPVRLSPEPDRPPPEPGGDG
jgi:hypothetical protein